DGVGDVCDNCSADANADQANGDGDALGDVCDACPAEAASTSNGCMADGGMPDAGAPDAGASSDAGASGDAGVAADGGSDEEGVPRVKLGCAAGGSGHVGWMVLLLGALLARRRRGAWAMLLALSLGSVATVHAQEEPTPEQITQAQTHFELGRINYEAGRFEEADREFSRAYELSRRPALLYNIFLARRDMGAFGPAAEALSEFLTRASNTVDPVQRQRLERTLETMQAQAARTASATPEPAEPAPVTEPEPEPVTEPDPVATPEPTPEPASSGGGRGRVIGAVALFGVAAVGVGLGVGMLVKRGNEADRLDDACTLGSSGDRCPADFDQQSVADDYSRASRIGVVGWGLAAASLAAGVVLLLLPGDEDAPRASVACTTEGCMAGVGGRF
ncbi:MAG: tetratricopeptide repeat protein, partial [Myxococcales bacterium]|nr:tetratricopeptide repeat protein [Myxococcales bacterium]